MLCAVRMQAFFRWFYPLQGGYLLVGVVVPLIVIVAGTPSILVWAWPAYAWPVRVCAFTANTNATLSLAFEYKRSALLVLVYAQNCAYARVRIQALMARVLSIVVHG